MHLSDVLTFTKFYSREILEVFKQSMTAPHALYW